VLTLTHHMGEGEEGEEELPHSNPDKKDWH